MTRLAHRATLKAVAMDPGVYDELQVDVQPSNKTFVIIDAAYAAWLSAYDALYAWNYGPRGGRTQGNAARFSAMRRITKELNYVDTHPAFQGLAMFGLVTETFPAWKIDTEPGRFLYSPYPQPGHQFVILTPTWQNRKWGDRPQLTWWTEQPSGVGRLAQEQLHLSLWRRPVGRVRNPQVDNTEAE